MSNLVFPDAAALASLYRRHHIQRLALFGSTLKGLAGPESDIDLLVEFETDQEPGLLRLASIEDELSALANGRQIDLRTARDLSRHFRDEVIRKADVQYVSV